MLHAPCIAERARDSVLRLQRPVPRWPRAAFVSGCTGRPGNIVSHDVRYALIMLVALVVMSVLLRRWQASLPLAWWQKLGIGVGGFCGAMIGAKLPFTLADWEGLKSGTTWFADGKTIMCGIVGGYFGVEIAKWTLDIRMKTG